MGCRSRHPSPRTCAAFPHAHCALNVRAPSANGNAALRAANYHADKLDELADAADAATALEAVARWNILDGKPRSTPPLPAADPPSVAPRVPPAQVYAAVLDEVTNIHARADDMAAVPPREQVTSETGSRKTSITLTALAGWIERRKAAHRPHRLAMLVPTHKLAKQIEADARRLGINAAVFEGRERGCRNHEAVTLAREVGADVNAAACGSLNGGPCCPFRQWC